MEKPVETAVESVPLTRREKKILAAECSNEKKKRQLASAQASLTNMFRVNDHHLLTIRHMIADLSVYYGTDSPLLREVEFLCSSFITRPAVVVP